jgi:hypothetical protein
MDDRVWIHNNHVLEVQMNSLTALLWMVMAWQQQNVAILPTCGPTSYGVCQIPSYQAPPFDVPPVEWRRLTLDANKESSSFVQGFAEGCTTDPNCISTTSGKFYEKTRTCADKSRFLLMDESGTWHCLALLNGSQGNLPDCVVGSHEPRCAGQP